MMSWIHSPISAALARALVDFLWQGTLIALVLGLALACCPRGSARLRYGFCCAAMMAMTVTFSLTFARSVRIEAPIVTSTVRHFAPSNPPYVPLPTQSLPPSDAPPDLTFLLPFWLAGVALCYLHGAASWLAVRRLGSAGACAAPAPWQEALKRLASELRISKPVRLLESCLVEVPSVAGILCPVILMPAGLLTGLSTAQVESILIHELAHIARRDYLVNLLQRFVEGWFFYHPAVWWVSSAMRAERETCCDEAVVALRGDALGYARTLLALEQSHRHAAEPALAATGGRFTTRIRRLLGRPHDRRGAAIPALLAGVAVIVLLAGMQSAGRDQFAPVLRAAAAPLPKPAAQQAQPAPSTAPHDTPAPAPTQPQVELSSPYKKWLNEDVVYIITKEERAEFLSLHSDKEREKFIENFWLRRDPTPGTVQNEFKEEHYRRIAYANEHFACAIPGWKTDRGRIYIKYGPPDEIDDHSAGGRYRRPPEQGGVEITWARRQQWRYRHIEGVGEDLVFDFVDPTNSGEFHLTTNPMEGLGMTTHSQEGDKAPQVPLAFLPLSNPDAVTVQPLHDRRVSIAVPLNAYGTGRITISGRIAAKPAPIHTLQGMPAGAPEMFSESLGSEPGMVFRIAVPLLPGVYRLTINVHDQTAGTVTKDEVDFTVPQ
jgi:GWxTD domain-containing protein